MPLRWMVEQQLLSLFIYFFLQFLQIAVWFAAGVQDTRLPRNHCRSSADC